MRRLAGLSVVVVLLCACLAACGGASKASRAPASALARSGSAENGSARRESLAARVNGDGDGDSPERTPFDGDDFHSMHFGHAADPADEQTISDIVKRYYAALAAQDAPTVCSMLLEVVAESLSEGEYGGVSQQGSTPLRPPCPAAISGALAESHRSLLSEARTLRVTGVRVRRRRASALLRFEGRAARHILLYEEEGKWKIGTLADEDLG